ncbi:MAG: type II toxin-antitoxin system HigB family toxin [Fimbriimonas sp.]|nr:type II toxin-antitoxin system HigB family toxin [Fimbriimonas sp.]
MHVIAKRTLREHWEKPGREDSQEPLEAWYAEAKSALWRNFGDIKQTSATASGVANNRVVLNIGGNKYRLIVKINYPGGIVFIRFVGTHQEYDRIDARSI